MRKRVHRAGGKFAGSHTTLAKEFCPIVDAAHDMDEVTKIILGPINSNAGRASSPMRVKCKELDGMAHGLHMTVTKGGVSQQFYIYVRDGCELAPIKKAGKRGKRTRNGNRKEHVNMTQIFGGNDSY